MRYTILGFNQSLVMEADLSLNDILLLDYIIYANGEPTMKHIVQDEVSYVWLNHDKIKEDLPILRYTEGTLRNKLSELKQKGLINSVTLANKSAKGTMTYYTITEKTTSFLNDITRHAEVTSYNILNNKNNKTNISKDILVSEPASDFKFGTEMNPPKKTNVSEYDLSIKMISEYTNDSMLKSELNKFVRLRKEMASKSKYHFYSSMIKNYLDELSNTFGNDDRAKIEAVRLSIRYNCTTKVMIPNTHFGDVSSSIEGFVSTDISNDGLSHNRAVDEKGNPLVF